jgi:hypothetical protein
MQTRFALPGDVSTRTDVRRDMDVASSALVYEDATAFRSQPVSSVRWGMDAALESPIAGSYWVLPHRLLAGKYPRRYDDASSRVKLRRLLDAGVTCFLDLTEEGEYGLKPYAPLLEEQPWSGLRALVHWRLPIPDRTAPSTGQMMRILDTLDGVLTAGHVVYLHCWGGIGRTGTVVGCHLVRRGMTGEQALAAIARMRQDTPDESKVSPETPDQTRLVLRWSAGM